MSQIFLNPSSAALVDTVMANLPHALLLTGAEGVGLYTIAHKLAASHFEGLIQPTDREGNPDMSPKGIIRAKQIRALVMQSSTKTAVRKVYIIDNADQMNHIAQNAFLKLLEEPASHTHFILTSHRPHHILPTIRSRVQTIHIDPIHDDQTELLLTKQKVHDATKRQQMVFLANGRPAELMRLVTDDPYFSTMSQHIRNARVLLQGSSVEQVTLIESYQGDRAKTLQLLDAALRILRFSLKKSTDQISLHKINALSVAYDRIEGNGNIRLQLVNFLLA